MALGRYGGAWLHHPMLAPEICRCVSTSIYLSTCPLPWNVSSCQVQRLRHLSPAVNREPRRVLASPMWRMGMGRPKRTRPAV